jgi:hypothetical protein
VRVQLRPRDTVAAVIALATIQATALADDRVDASTTWFQEKRSGGAKGLTVLHPQVDLGADLGETVSLDLGYSADVVSGATAAVYSVDAISSATEFSDTRHSGTLGLGLTGRRSSLHVTGAVGVERDYTSIAVGVSSSIDLPGKNTSLALSYTHNFDAVCDKENAMATPFERRPLSVEACVKEAGLFGVDRPEVDGAVVDTVWRDISIDSTQATLTQNLTPTLVAQLGLYGSIIDGFQGSPYRRVRVAGIEAQESVPEVRGRLAVLGRVNKYITAMRGSVGGSARGYFDTWGVNSITLEMSYHQYLGKHLLFRFRGRGYQQTSATFFKDAFFYETEGPAGAYFTGDRELAPLRHVLAGAKLSYVAAGEDGENVWGLFDEVDLNLKADALFYQELAADDELLNPMGIEGQFLTGDGALDAFVLQLGLILRY